MSTPGIQVCFCGPGCTALPAEPLDAHGDGCLIWDWSAAQGKITPAQLLGKIDGHVQELGLTEEELETASMPAAMLEMLAAVQAMGGPSPRRDHISLTCYRSDYGFMVHIKGACRCPR